MSFRTALFFAASFLLPALPAWAQNGGLLFVTSVNPRGNAALTAKEGSRVLEVRHSIVSPRDPQSGLPTGQRRDPQSGLATGKRQWKPVTILKEADTASPKFFQALKRNEALGVKIEFDRGGKTVQTIELRDAHISHIQKVKRGNKDVEEIEFVYQQIEVTHSDGKKTQTDDWIESK